MKTGSIHGVGTLEESRRRGIGTTLTLHAIMDSINEGHDLHTLQTEKGGYVERFYKEMGFTTEYMVSWYIKVVQGKN